MSEVTRILCAIEHDDPRAAEQLLPLVYDELRKLAAQRLSQEKPGQTLEATALVHEAYLRLVGDGQGPHWDHRGHFFAAAAEAMRRILVDAARRKQAVRRGGRRRRVTLHDHHRITQSPDDLLALSGSCSGMRRMGRVNLGEEAAGTRREARSVSRLSLPRPCCGGSLALASTEPPMSEVTRNLSDIEQGDPTPQRGSRPGDGLAEASDHRGLSGCGADRLWAAPLHGGARTPLNSIVPRAFASTTR
jgi:RNA polymerase sigma factor (TIGR02999 family)